MSVCCPLYGGDYGPSCSKSCLRLARKPHQCVECGKTIVPGEKYEYVSGIWDGSPSSFKTCLLCREIRNHFACEDGCIYGDLWEQLQQNFLPTMVAGGPCLEGLSPAAKAALFEAKLMSLGIGGG